MILSMSVISVALASLLSFSSFQSVSSQSESNSSESVASAQSSQSSSQSSQSCPTLSYSPVINRVSPEQISVKLMNTGSNSNSVEWLDLHYKLNENGSQLNERMISPDKVSTRFNNLNSFDSKSNSVEKLIDAKQGDDITFGWTYKTNNSDVACSTPTFRATSDQISQGQTSTTATSTANKANATLATSTPNVENNTTTATPVMSNLTSTTNNVTGNANQNTTTAMIPISIANRNISTSNQHQMQSGSASPLSGVTSTGNSSDINNARISNSNNTSSSSSQRNKTREYQAPPLLTVTSAVCPNLKYSVKLSKRRSSNNADSSYSVLFVNNDRKLLDYVDMHYKVNDELFQNFMLGSDTNSSSAMQNPVMNISPADKLTFFLTYKTSDADYSCDTNLVEIKSNDMNSGSVQTVEKKNDITPKSPTSRDANQQR